jgi:rhodanese-related sulfurtransferase
MQKITADDAKDRLDRGETVIFVDARSPEAWSKSDLQIPNSIRVPPDEAHQFVAALPPDATIVTYCT